MKLNYLVLAVSLLGSLWAQAFDLNVGVNAIYGVDDRKETSEFHGQMEATQARSVAVQIKNEKMSLSKGIYKILKPETLKEKNHLCANEAFEDEISVGSCTGFLVAPNILVTAAHCMSTVSDCQESKWYFDFTKGKTTFKSEDVYSCSKILKFEKIKTDSRHIDYSIVKLDRPVKNRAPLEYRKSGTIPPFTPVYTIGYPSGLPQKITENGRVVDSDKVDDFDSIFNSYQGREYFTTTLDTFGGNSGSPVFNYMTGEVEAILVSGSSDYHEVITKDGVECSKVTVYKDENEQANERAIKITKIPLGDFIN